MTQDITSSTVVPFPHDLTLVLRSRIREAIELVLGEEIEAALAQVVPSGWRNARVTGTAR